MVELLWNLALRLYNTVVISIGFIAAILLFLYGQYTNEGIWYVFGLTFAAVALFDLDKALSQTNRL
jgi:hypothetical protein